MSGAPFAYVLLVLCWISALVTLVIFVESWIALTRRSRLEPRRASQTQGVVSILIPLSGRTEASRRALMSILEQSYPFIELLLIHNEEDPHSVSLVEEVTHVRSHVPIRPVPAGFSIDNDTNRIRALELAQASVQGSWILVLDPDVVLDEHAVESALEFAQSEGLTAVALSPGIDCRSLGQKLLAPSLEWLVRMIRVVDRGREHPGRLHSMPPFILLHGQTHTVINKINRLPGVLNESGWTLWSFRVEGLKTFQGDGSGWAAREGTVRSVTSSLEGRSIGVGRAMAFVLGSAVIWVLSVVGVLFGLSAVDAGFAELGVLYFSAFSYSLMACSYFFYSRRLGAATWFSPLWFLAHSVALVLVMTELGRSETVTPRVDLQAVTRKVHTSKNQS